MSDPYDLIFAKVAAGSVAQDEPAPEEAAAPASPAAPARSAAYERGRAVSNPLRRGLVNVMQGPLMGFGDELLAGMSAAVQSPFSDRTFGELYEMKRDKLRGIEDQYKEDFPVGSTATKIAASAPLIAKNVVGKAVRGGLETVAPAAAGKYFGWVAPAGEAAGIVPRVVHGAAAGSLYGAAAALGDSTASSVGGQVRDAAFGALTGGAVGGGTPIITGGLNAMVNQVVPRFSDRRAQDFAREKVAEALVRDTSGAAPGVSDAAGRAATRMRTLGPEARVVDSAGQNTRQLLDTVATLPGQTKETLERAIRSRQAGRAARLVNAADDALQTGGAKFNDSIEEFSRQRSADARPLYQQLEGLAVRVDDDLATMLAKTRSAHGEAERLWETKTGTKIDLSSIKTGDVVPFEVLDTLKGSLYDVAQTAKRAGGSKLGMAYDNVRVSLTDKLTRIAPHDENGSVYRQALDLWAGPSQMIDAAEIGRKAMRGDAMELAAEIRRMSVSEIDAMRVGALQALREKAGTQAGQTSLLKMWMEPATRDRLKIAFGGDYRKFAADVAREARLKPMEQLGRGSQTAPRQYGAGDLDVAAVGELAGNAASAAASPSVGTVSALRNAWNRVQTPEPVRDAIGKILLSRDPMEIQSLTGLLDDVNRKRAQVGGQAAQFTGLLY